MTIRVLPALYGDCLLVSWHHENNVRNILIDGGPSAAYYRCIQPMVAQLREKKEQIDLLMVTHCDHDHIGGILEWYRDEEADRSLIKEVWFNSGGLIAKKIANETRNDRDIKIIPGGQVEMSFKEGNTLEGLLTNANTELIKVPGTAERYGAGIHILSPGPEQLGAIQKVWTVEEDDNTQMSGKTCDHNLSFDALLSNPFKHDRALPNGSSIVTLVEANCKTMLLLADAFPDVVEKSLRNMGYNEDNKLPVDVVKVAHHGSKFNNSPGLYSIIRSQKFIISTDGSKHKMPHKEAMARIVVANPGCTLYFNYKEPAEDIFSIEEKEKYHFSTVNLADNDYLLEL